jgi:signal transduction histidine kinase
LHRVAWLLAAVTGLLVGAMTWVAMLRHRVQLQTAIIGERLQSEAALEERARIARELHDTVEQDLAAVGMHLDVIADRATELEPMARENLSAAVRHVRRSQADMHHAVWDLRSGALVELGLAAAVEESLHRSVGPPGVQAIYELRGVAQRFPGVVEHHLLRIAQEEINNAVHHARPHRIHVLINYEDSSLTMRIEDDGCGFSDATESKAEPRFGLLGMQERAARIGACLAIQSRPSAGTIVEVKWPSGESSI